MFGIIGIVLLFACVFGVFVAHGGDLAPIIHAAPSELATIGGAGDAADVDGDISKLLAGWKQDQNSLLQRFDLNRDGRIDLQEWELARRQARREVEAARLEKSMAEGTHTLRQPQDGRLFLLSNYLPDR